MSSLERERALFEQAGELPPSERAVFLAEACAGDEALRARVEALLAADTEEGNALDVPAIEGLSSGPTRAGERPERIGPYRVLGVLGAGGMGVVYEAKQENPERRVALKVVRPGFVTESLLRRFEHEARVLGWLNHPGIAQIYEAGTADTGHGPQPFFAMELVRGAPLMRYADQAGLDVEARLELLARVCDAVQHAHQKGVIHRDLKPGNVLVDEAGQPKVLDFGVARVTDEDLQATTLHTQVGELVGTLTYMSPEQVSGQPQAVDTRSDVYALGVIAHELLAGQPPLDLRGKLVHEAARAITEDEPSTLGALNASLRGDVETIVAKSLEKEKDRRYASAEELASDIRRYLSDEPIVARPASAMYQLNKFARRNRALVAGLAGVFLAVAAGAVVSTLLYRDARRGWGEEARQRELSQTEQARAEQAEADARSEQARAEQAEAEARAEQVRAEQAEAEARSEQVRAEQAEAEARREAATAEEVARFLVDVFEVADPEQGDEDWRADITARELLDSARGRIAGDLVDQPVVRARLLEELGRVYRNLGLYDEAIELLREASELHDATGQASRAAENRALIALATSQAQRPTEAEPLLLAALEDLRNGGDATSESSVLSSLARVQNQLGRFDEAASTARDAVAAAVRDHGEGSPKALTAQNALTLILTLNESYDEAIEEGRRSFEQHLAAYGPDHLDTVAAEGQLAMALSESGDSEAALPHMRNVLAKQEAHYPEGHPKVLVSMSNLAVTLMRLKRSEPALELSERSLELFGERFGRDNRRYALGLHNQATILTDLGRYQDAERRSFEAQSTLEQLEPNSPLMANILAVRGEILASQLLRPAEARPLLERSIEIQSSVPGATPLLKANAVNALGIALIKLGELDAAEARLSELLALYREAYGPNHDKVARTLSNLGKVAMDRGDPAAALDYIVESHAILEQVLPEGHPVFGYTLLGQARALAELKRFEEAEVEGRAALALRETALPPGHPLTAESRMVVADCLVGRGLPEEAEPQFLEALATFEAAYPADHADVVRARARLVKLYERLGNEAQAEQYR